MNAKNKSYLSLIIWIIGLIAVGSVSGLFTKPEIKGWYATIERSSLTPPNYIFPIAWTILYGMIGAAGWNIWTHPSTSNHKVVKTLFLGQLLLNWSWTPIFFHYHLTGTALLILGALDMVVATLIWQTHEKIKAAALLLLPYFLWILFATYLNGYIWWFNT